MSERERERRRTRDLRSIAIFDFFPKLHVCLDYNGQQEVEHKDKDDDKVEGDKDLLHVCVYD